MENALVGFVAVKVVVFAHAIAKVVKREEIGARRRVTFGVGFSIPSVVLFSAIRSRAPPTLSFGGCNNRQ
jgi:hypothetical protein